MLNTLRHLLPDSTAWRLVVERTLKKYLRGVATVGSDTVEFVDDVYDDLWPDLTRELQEWLDQFGIDYWAWSNDDDMRAYLDFRWGEDRSTSPQALQDKLQAAGFDAYVYDSFDMADVELTTDTGDETSALSEITTPVGFDLALGGTRLYVADDVDDEIHQYSLQDEDGVSTPYDLSNATYDNKLIDVTTNANPTDIYMRNDGAKLYVLNQGTDDIAEYDLSTPFDVSTAVHLQNGTDFTTQEALPRAMHFALDGTRVYITGTGSDQVHRFDMSTAWDVSSMSHVNSYDPTFTDPDSLTFTSDGLVMLLSATAGVVTQYNLSTAWDITSASAASKTLDVTPPVATGVSSVKLLSNRLLALGSTSTPKLHRFRYGAWRDPLTYADQPLAGTVQCGDDGSAQNPVAECGEEPPDQVSLDSAVCNNFLANEVWYLVNDTLTADAPPKIPTDSAQWGPFWYVGGTPIGTELEVDEYDRQRFEKLCLKHGPAEAWIVTIIDIWRTTLISEWAYGDAATILEPGEWQFTDGATTPLKIHDWDSPNPPNVADEDLDTYAYRTGIAGADQEIRFNHASVPASISTCWLGKSDQSSTSHETEIDNLAIGDWIRYTKTDGEYIEVQLTGTPTDNTTYYVIAVANGRASPAFTFPADDTNGNVELYPSTTSAGVDQSTPLSGIASGDKLRFERSDNGSWIEYVTVGASTDQTSHWLVPFNTTPTSQSSDWAGFPSVGGLMQIHHRESV